MNRREFIMLLGGAAAVPAWPLVVRAQQAPMPVIGFLHSQSADGFTEPLRAFRQGLKDTGYVDGENVAIEYSWGDNQNDRLPALAAELVRRRVAVIATFSPPVALAAKAATTTIPIVFNSGDDPVRLGLVASLARPEGNLTGINFLVGELAAKRLELLRELMPGATRVALLLDPSVGQMTETTLADVEAAARPKGLQIQVLNVQASHDINAAFATFMHDRPDALYVGPGPFFTSRRVQLALLAAVQRVPAIYSVRPFAEAGGLISYGASLTDAYRQVGAYAGRILKGAKPADLPVVQSSKFELVINAETARILGLTVPDSLLARADEVIE
jgi:putative tryptophan/tyrosine transport system substrate-binding protein